MAVRGTDFKNEIRDFDAITKEKKVEGQEIKAVRADATAHRSSRRHLRGVKEESGNRRPAEKPNRRSRQAQKEGVGFNLFSRTASRILCSGMG